MRYGSKVIAGAVLGALTLVGVAGSLRADGPAAAAPAADNGAAAEDAIQLPNRSYSAGPLSQGPQSILSANSQIYQKVGIDQRLDNQVPLDLTFKDEAGEEVQLSKYFNQNKPVVLALVYYKCPMLCTMTLNGMVGAFKPVSLTIGKEYDVVTVSFDPTEGPDLAAKKKENYVKAYKRPGADKGWHFLTGDEENIKKLAEAVGFRYFWDTRSQQYGHSSAIMVLTPGGKVSRYFYGLEYAPKDLRLGLVEASEGKIGTLADAVTLLCYHYDPTTGKYGLAIMRTLQVAGVATILAIGSFITLMVRRDRALTAERAASVAGAAKGAGGPPGAGK